MTSYIGQGLLYFTYFFWAAWLAFFKNQYNPKYI